MRRCRIAMLLGLLLPPLPAVVAAPLDKADCDKLKAEQAELEQQGARAAMANGLQWAKVNLKPEQLDQIRHIIDVDGQLLFRCNGRPLVALPKDVEADPVASDAGEIPKEAPGVKRETDTPAGEKPSPAPQAKAALGTAKAPVADGRPKAAVKKAAAGQRLPVKPAHAANGTGAAGEQAPRATQKAKAKPRVDDAYKPPASEPSANPFANQLVPAQKN
jgi:hypothetical protein